MSRKLLSRAHALKAVVGKKPNVNLFINLLNTCSIQARYKGVSELNPCSVTIQQWFWFWLSGGEKTNTGFVSFRIVICWRSLTGRPDLRWRVSRLPAAVWSDAAGSVCLKSNLKLTSLRLHEGQRNWCSRAQTARLRTHFITWKLFFAHFVCIFWWKKRLCLLLSLFMPPRSAATRLPQ